MEKTLFLNIRGIFWKYRWRLLGSFVLIALSNSLLILNPLLFRLAVSSLAPIAGQVPTKGPALWAWGALLVTVAMTSAFLKYWMRLGFFSVGSDVERDLRHKLFCRIQEQSMPFFDRHGTGELLSRLTNDISSYRDVLGPGLIYPLFFVTIVTPALIALFYISPRLTMLSLVPLAVIPLFNQVIRSQVFYLSVHVQKKLADLSNITQEHFSSIRLIKGYVAESTLYRLFSDMCRKLMRYNLKLVIRLGMILPFFTMLTKVITVLLVLYSGALILKAWGELSAADFVSFMWIQNYIFFPLLMLGWVFPIYARGRAAYHRLVEIYSEPIEVAEGKNRDIEIAPGDDIVFKNLSFTYPSGANPALSDIDMTIKGGTFVGLTGPIGAGKSTLFKLLNREYEIPPGTLFIGDHDIRDYTYDALHRAIVNVEQAPFLFSKTIADNVRFGDEEASQLELEMVAKYADLHETILEFPESYETLIGERGMTLSGGQKQRVALARAFLVKRSILLLDDIFSAVDTHTEKKIFHSLKTHFKGKTVLLITHRISILEQMDRVLFMKEGRIVEDGMPKELMAVNGYYAALAALQGIP